MIGLYLIQSLVFGLFLSNNTATIVKLNTPNPNKYHQL